MGKAISEQQPAANHVDDLHREYGFLIPRQIAAKRFEFPIATLSRIGSHTLEVRRSIASRYIDHSEAHLVSPGLMRDVIEMHVYD